MFVDLRALRTLPPYFISISTGKLVLNHVRSSGTHPLNKTIPQKCICVLPQYQIIAIKLKDRQNFLTPATFLFYILKKSLLNKS